MPARGPVLTRRTRPSTDDDLEALRKLVVGPEQVRLDKVEKPAPSLLGGMLPEAVSHAQVARPDELAATLEKPVTSAVRRIARREPAFFGEILAPTIGTAVRRAVADSITALIQRINEIVETRMSLRSLRWRLEARRRRRPYAEIVLAHTLVYRVEWAVLIDTRTSLVLAQASSSEAIPHAPDQTAAMLAAINTFVSDAMQPASPGAAVHAIEVGDLRLWIERDPLFTLAIALRGVAPLALRDDLRETLELVHALHGEPEPVVDAAAFEDVQPLLLDLIRQEVRRPPSRARWLLLAVGCLVVVAIGFATFRRVARVHEDVHRRLAYRDLLASAPGIVVTAIERDHRHYRIRGLRDPRAASPELLVAVAGLPPATFELAPYQSLDPRFAPTASPMDAVDAAVRGLEDHAIEFARGDATAAAHAEELDRVADQIGRVQRAASAANVGLCVEVLGDSDESGGERLNDGLRAARASAVVHALERAGIAPGVLAPRAGDPLRTRPRDRRVTFRAVTRGCP